MRGFKHPGAHGIHKQKAEFLLNSIRDGGIHELMQKEMIKLLLQDGYQEHEIRYYLENGDWPSKQQSDWNEYHSDDEYNDGLIGGAARKARAFRNVIVFGGLLIGLLIFAIAMGSIFGNKGKDKTNLSPASIEQKTNGKNTL